MKIEYTEFNVVIELKYLRRGEYFSLLKSIVTPEKLPLQMQLLNWKTRNLFKLFLNSNNF